MKMTWNSIKFRINSTNHSNPIKLNTEIEFNALIQNIKFLFGKNCIDSVKIENYDRRLKMWQLFALIRDEMKVLLLLESTGGRFLEI